MIVSSFDHIHNICIHTQLQQYIYHSKLCFGGDHVQQLGFGWWCFGTQRSLTKRLQLSILFGQVVTEHLDLLLDELRILDQMFSHALDYNVKWFVELVWCITTYPSEGWCDQLEEGWFIEILALQLTGLEFLDLEPLVLRTHTTSHNNIHKTWHTGSRTCRSSNPDWTFGIVGEPCPRSPWCPWCWSCRGCSPRSWGWSASQCHCTWISS